jgi:hypothetical protein
MDTFETYQEITPQLNWKLATSTTKLLHGEELYV